MQALLVLDGQMHLLLLIDQLSQVLAGQRPLARVLTQMRLRKNYNHPKSKLKTTYSAFNSIIINRIIFKI